MKKSYRVSGGLKGFLSHFRKDRPSDIMFRVIRQMYWESTLSVEHRYQDFQKLIQQNSKRL